MSIGRSARHDRKLPCSPVIVAPHSIVDMGEGMNTKQAVASPGQSNSHHATEEARFHNWLTEWGQWFDDMIRIYEEETTALLSESSHPETAVADVERTPPRRDAEG